MGIKQLSHTKKKPAVGEIKIRKGDAIKGLLFDGEKIKGGLREGRAEGEGDSRHHPELSTSFHMTDRKHNYSSFSVLAFGTRCQSDAYV